MNDEIEIERKEQYRPSSKGNSNNFLEDKKKMILIGVGVLAAVFIVLSCRIFGKGQVRGDAGPDGAKTGRHRAKNCRP